MAQLARLLLVLLALSALPGLAAAQTLRLPESPAEIEAFFDGLLPSLMESYHVPGATLAVVRGGEIVLEKGYGHADDAKRRPADPRSTLFRLASVSKLVTTTAAMQLVQAGKLDLHTDVNTYLDAFQIEEKYDQPVTLHHLLTHTAGFDDRFLRSGYELGAEHPSLGEYLAERMPPRVMPPGVMLSYSNHGLALVGYLVERVSGQRFEDYVQEHVFGPLGMSSSRFGLPFPKAEEAAVGYYWEGRHADIGYDYTMLGPAAELVSTAHDMAKFMIAHLQLGRLGDQRILDEDTARLMQTTQFRFDPRMPGWCYGFEEGQLHGKRTIGHGGSWRGFRTSLMLEPESGVGVFVSLNSELEGGFWRGYVRGLADFAVPAPEPPEITPPEDFASRADRYTGDYIPNRRIRGTILKVGLLLGNARITASDEGTLVFTPSSGDPVHFVEVEKDWFRQVDGYRQARFLADPEDRVTGVALGGFAMDRVPALESPRLQGLLGVLGLGLFGATVVGWTWGAVSRRLFGGAASPVSPVARGVAGLVCGLYFVTIGGTAVSLQEARLFDILIEFPLRLKLLLAAPMLAAPLTLALPVLALRAFQGGSASLPVRVHYWLVVAFSFVFLWMCWYWNLLGFKY